MYKDLFVIFDTAQLVFTIKQHKTTIKQSALMTALILSYITVVKT